MSSQAETHQPVSDTTTEEDLRNRGTITVLEQTRQTETHDIGDRFIVLGYETELYQLADKGTEDQDFVVQAVPVAHIQLPHLLDEDELNEWLNSDVGKLVAKPFFEGMDAPDVLTEWGQRA